MLDQLDVGRAQGRFGLRDQGVVDERCPHRIEQPILVDAEDDEGDFGSKLHGGSLVVRSAYFVLRSAYRPKNQYYYKRAAFIKLRVSF